IYRKVEFYSLLDIPSLPTPCRERLELQTARLHHLCPASDPPRDAPTRRLGHDLRSQRYGHHTHAASGKPQYGLGLASHAPRYCDDVRRGPGEWPARQTSGLSRSCGRVRERADLASERASGGIAAVAPPVPDQITGHHERTDGEA